MANSKKPIQSNKPVMGSLCTSTIQVVSPWRSLSPSETDSCVRGYQCYTQYTDWYNKEKQYLATAIPICILIPSFQGQYINAGVVKYGMRIDSSKTSMIMRYLKLYGGRIYQDETDKKYKIQFDCLNEFWDVPTIGTVTFSGAGCGNKNYKTSSYVSVNFNNDYASKVDAKVAVPSFTMSSDNWDGNYQTSDKWWNIDKTSNLFYDHYNDYSGTWLNPYYSNKQIGKDYDYYDFFVIRGFLMCCSSGEWRGELENWKILKMLENVRTGPGKGSAEIRYDKYNSGRYILNETSKSSFKHDNFTILYGLNYSNPIEVFDNGGDYVNNATKNKGYHINNSSAILGLTNSKLCLSHVMSSSEETPAIYFKDYAYRLWHFEWFTGEEDKVRWGSNDSRSLNCPDRSTIHAMFDSFWNYIFKINNERFSIDGGNTWVYPTFDSYYKENSQTFTVNPGVNYVSLKMKGSSSDKTYTSINNPYKSG